MAERAAACPAGGTTPGKRLVYFPRVLPAADTLRVVIADDHHLFREGLRTMLQEAGMEVVGEASDGADAVALARELRPDVVVLDLNMPGTSGLQALRRLARERPNIQAVVLTVSADDTDVLEALAGGACGYLLKDTRPDRLVEGIRQAAEGQVMLSGEVARALMARVRADADAHAVRGEEAMVRAEIEAGRAAAVAARPALTPREAEVLRLIAEGADNVAIGLELSISPHTVKQYVTNIFEKLGVRSRVQAAVYAVRAGLV
jgi:two-component system nitrate/nitrite response regulator NarL